MAQGNNKPRGFVIVIVVAIAAVITAIVAAQLTSSQKLAAASLRFEEEVQARAIAQACLEMVSAQIDNYMFDCGALPLPACATRPPDFDALLLGVDGAAGTPDDYLPGIGDRVQIPRSATDQLHQWALLDLDGGACAMRIEDNSDDGRPALPGMADSAGEGLGTDVPNRDRDLAVYIHVIGMYPRLVTSDDDVYHKAHARTTLRRMIQKQNMASPSGPGLWARVSIDVDDDNNICELGGVKAPTVDMEPSTCACGPISCTTCSGTPPAGTTCSACTSGCTPSTNTGFDGIDPPVNVHWANTATAGTSFRSNEGLGPPLRADPLEGDVLPEVPTGQGSVVAAPITAYDLSSTQFCAFYTDSAAGLPLFVWDRLDTDAGLSHENWRDNGVWDLAPPATQHAAVAAVSGGAPVDCTVHTADIPEPCVWTKGASDATAATLTSCPTAKSACWKLIGWFGESDSYAVGLNNAQVPLRGWTDNGSDKGFHPRKSRAIPNTARGPAGEERVFGAPAALSTQQLLCGDPNPLRNCRNCNSLGAVDAVGGADNNVASVLDSHSDHWHFEGGARDDLAPSPSVWVMENRSSSDKDAHLKDVGDPSVGPFRATILVDGDADLENNAGICCATCNCTALTSLSMAGCALNGTFGDAPSGILGTLVGANQALFTNTAPPTEDNRTLLNQGGIAIKAREEINVNNSALIIGDVRGGTVDFNNNPCVIGSVVSYGTSAASECSSNCSSSHVCFDNAPKITGDVHSMTSIRFNNNPRIWGNIFAKRDVCFNDDARVEGLIQAGQSMELDQDSIIVNNVASSSGAATTALNQALVTFMEGAW
jgi:hypothetical protein